LVFARLQGAANAGVITDRTTAKTSRGIDGTTAKTSRGIDGTTAKTSGGTDATTAKTSGSPGRALYFTRRRCLLLRLSRQAGQIADRHNWRVTVVRHDR
jgi:hypothetical protein